MKMFEAKTTIPHFYLSVDCNLDRLIELCTQLNDTLTATARLSINDFVIKAGALALRSLPEANVAWSDTALLQLADVDISVAVATGQAFHQWQMDSGTSGETSAVIDPSTGKEYGRLAPGTVEDIDAAVRAARSAFEEGAWTRLTAAERGRLLLKFAGLILERKEELAQIHAPMPGESASLSIPGLHES